MKESGLYAKIVGWSEEELHAGAGSVQMQTRPPCVQVAERIAGLESMVCRDCLLVGVRGQGKASSDADYHLDPMFHLQVISGHDKDAHDMTERRHLQPGEICFADHL